MNTLLHDESALIKTYRAIALPDEDVVWDVQSWSDLFAIMAAHEIDLCHPSLVGDAETSFTAPQPDTLLRWTNMVGPKVPVLSRRAIGAINSTVSAGAELPEWPAISTYLFQSGYRIAIIDSIPFRYLPRDTRQGVSSTVEAVLTNRSLGDPVYQELGRIRLPGQVGVESAPAAPIVSVLTAEHGLPQIPTAPAIAQSLNAFVPTFSSAEAISVADSGVATPANGNGRGNDTPHLLMHNDRIHALAAEGHWKEAEDRMRAALRKRPDDIGALYALGLALVGLNRTAEAVIVFRQAARLRPASPNAHLGLASALARLGKSAEAEATCGLAFRLNPSNPTALDQLSDLYRQSGRMAEAAASSALSAVLEHGKATVDPCKYANDSTRHDFECRWTVSEWQPVFKVGGPRSMAAAPSTSRFKRPTDGPIISCMCVTRQRPNSALGDILLRTADIFPARTRSTGRG